MNIKQHIEAGHYERDDAGRSIVPMRSGTVAFVCATNGPAAGRPLLGWMPGNAAPQCWQPDGAHYNSAADGSYIDLLPPPPRKVKVTAWALIVNGEVVDVTKTPRLRDAWRNGLVGNDRLIELGGEYEQPWITDGAEAGSV